MSDQPGTTNDPTPPATPRPPDPSLDSVHFGPDIGSEAEFRLLGPLADKRVLQLGCATAQSLVAMARQGARVIAIDDSPDLLERARRVCEREEVRLELKRADLADLAFQRADSVDVVLSIYSLADVDDLNRVFRQVHRVLAPGGPIVMSLPHPAYAMVDSTSAHPVTINRRYFGQPEPESQPDATSDYQAPRESDRPATEDEEDEAPRRARTIASVFTSLTRANFRVDTILEPEPDRAGPRSKQWSEAMAWVPATLIIRARKEGS